MMKEEFLHFLWRTRRFDAAQLFTTDGLPVEVLQPGAYNTHSGPDFFNARVRIGPTEWAGNVEMHLRSSDWYAHTHQNDPAYAGVILHVVWDDDRPVLRANGESIPCLSLKNRVSPGILQVYEQLMQATAWIPCAASFERVPSVLRLNWFDRLLVERLEQKTAHIEQCLEQADHHWEEVFYRLLARSFGLKVNQEPFEALARSLPLTLLQRHKSNPLQIEALLFGQAGLLEGEFKEHYPRILAKEYAFLRHKYELSPLPGAPWKFLRMRPANFPTIRIAQLGALIQHSHHLFSSVLAAESIRELEHLLTADTNNYWRLHYRFDMISVQQNRVLGKDFIHLIIVNTIVPLVFYYGKSRHDTRLQTKALSWLEALSPEQNKILSEWRKLGISPRHAYDAQAMIHLKQHYCEQQRCLQCPIGAFLLQKG